MSLRAENYKDYDSYIQEVIRTQEELDIGSTGVASFHIADDTVITLPSETSGGSQFREDIWEWPEFLFPHLSRSSRCINFALPHDLRMLGGDGLLRTIKLVVLLALIFPAAKRKRLPSLREMTRVLNEYCYDMLTKANVQSFAELNPDTYAKLIEQFGRGHSSYKRRLLSSLETLRAYGRRGLLNDYPGANGLPQRGSLSDNEPVDVVAGNKSASLLSDDVEDPDAREDGENPRQYQPLPDEYLAEMGWRCVFYLDQIGPNLVRLFADHPDQPHRREKWFPTGRSKAGPVKETVQLHRTRAWKEFLYEFRWIDSDGRPLTSMPFSCDGLVFPPVRHMDVLKLVGRHMDALIHMLILLSGGRASEVKSFRRNVVRRASSSENTEDGFALVGGQTMKPSATNLGDSRNWPIPETVAEWITNQTTLAKELGPADSQSIWMGMSTSNPGSFRVDMYYRCTQFAARHGLAHLVDGTAHPHRYRKSIARLALLALSGAPMLIMQMFGHRDLMATLHYLLSSPSIRDDLRELLGERRIEIALNLMEDVDAASGRAASTLRSARDAYFDEMRVPLNARSQKITLLQFVTARLVDGAVDIKIVYPGVICIRGMEQDGACALKGAPIDAARCQSSCNFRMDLSLRKSEVVAIMEDCLDAYLLARGGQNPLVLSALAANIFDNVEIFPEIRAFYLKDERYQIVASEHD